MQSTKTKSLAVLALASMFLMAFAMTAFGAEGETAEYVPALFSTFWALVPPVVAIGLAATQRMSVGSLLAAAAFPLLPVYRDRRRRDPVFRREL